MRYPLFILAMSLTILLQAPVASATLRLVPAGYPTIQSAIDAAAEHDTVLVSSGTYREFVFLQKNLVLTSVAGAEQTHIAADFYGEIVVCLNVDATAEISGFTIEGNSANGIGCYSSSPVIKHNVIPSRDEIPHGPLVSFVCQGPAPGPLIADNRLDALNLDGEATLIGNLITRTVRIHGAGTRRIIGNRFDPRYGNEGMQIYGGPVLVANNLILGRNVGVEPRDGADVTIVNNTIIGGSGFTRLIGIWASSTQPRIANNIIVGYDRGIWATDGGNPSVSHNDVWDCTTAYDGIADPTGQDGNLAVNPLFVDRTAGDFHLRPDSPCMDAGSNSDAAPFEFDLDGNPRLLDGDGNGSAVVDMGCFELGPQQPVCTQPIQFEMSPNTLNLRSFGRWVTATLEPEPPASPADIDVGSIRLNGSISVDASAPVSMGDVDHDGRPDLTIKFERSLVELAVEQGDAVPITVSGDIGSGCFEANDTIRVIRGHVTAPIAGTVLAGAGTTEVRWDTPAGLYVQSVAMLWSGNDGASWTLVTRNLPNTGSYSWTVPNLATATARIAVLLVESGSGDDMNAVVSMSDRFTISATLDVERENLGFALYGAIPNPSLALNVSFSLGSAEPTKLVVYDVSGRVVYQREIGMLDAGRHVISIGGHKYLAPGVYVIHLIQRNRRLSTRATVVQ